MGTAAVFLIRHNGPELRRRKHCPVRGQLFLERCHQPETPAGSRFEPCFVHFVPRPSPTGGELLNFWLRTIFCEAYFCEACCVDQREYGKSARRT